MAGAPRKTKDQKKKGVMFSLSIKANENLKLDAENNNLTRTALIELYANFSNDDFIKTLLNIKKLKEQNNKDW